jgi:CRISPR-associated protein Csm3
MKRLTKKLIYQGNLLLKSGLHIGASKENAEIGGVDHPIVRRKDNNQPYIPGSSIKGKIRSLLEQRRGAANIGDNEEVNNLFGFAEKNKSSKIIVRDSFLIESDAKKLKENSNTDLPFSEVKFENTINRVTGKASNPRQIERVPAGVSFKLEFVLNVWSDDDESDLKSLLEEGITLLNNDYLGGNGTRGYGHILIEMKEPKNILNND